MLLYLSRIVMSTAVPLIIFPLIFWAQLRLGYEVAMFPLYMIPVAKLAWEFGWRGGVVAVALATCLWLVASSVNEQPYSYEWLRYYNAAIRGVVFGFVAVFILLFKRVVEQHRRRMEAMRALLNVCHGCGSVQGSDGRWIPFEELSQRTPARLSCECPACTTLSENERSR